MAVTPEILIPRLGDVLVEQGKITQEQLLHALEVQKHSRLEGRNILLGQLLVELGIIDNDSLNNSITQQILILQTSLREANENLERKVQERTAELEIAYKKLSELSQLKANFVANISHELRTPLTHINGYVDLLLSDTNATLSPEQSQSVEVIKRAAGRLERLIDDLLLYSTSETDQLSIQLESMDPELIINNVFENNLIVATKKNISLNKQIENRSHSLQIDKAKITWVLNQLVDNAIKYTNAGGTITLSMLEKPEGYEFSVKDTGIGIPKDKFEEIFELFHQLDGSSTRTQGGMGLGLALVQTILKAHHSKIIVASTPGKGSSFSFVLLKE